MYGVMAGDCSVGGWRWLGKAFGNGPQDANVGVESSARALYGGDRAHWEFVYWDTRRLEVLAESSSVEVYLKSSRSVKAVLFPETRAERPGSLQLAVST